MVFRQRNADIQTQSQAVAPPRAELEVVPKRPAKEPCSASDSWAFSSPDLEAACAAAALAIKRDAKEHAEEAFADVFSLEASHSRY